MSEISCQNCQAACCRGDMIMYLTTEERVFMEQGGNEFLKIADPKFYPREEVPYPIGYERDEYGNLIGFIFEQGREYEPLAAGMGRYALVSTSCNYLETDEDGWQRCGVYDKRPQVCRDFEVGADKCQLMRKVYGVDVEPLPIV